MVKKIVIIKFLPELLSKPTNGNMINVDANEITNPTEVLVNDSIKDCFLVCITKPLNLTHH